jgi:chemotaxis protein MotA
MECTFALLLFVPERYAIVSHPIPDNLQVSKQDSVEIWQLIPLVLAAALLTIGLAMFMSGIQHPIEIIQPVIVVFGGTLAALLLTFPTGQLTQSLKTALARGLRGGTAPAEMIRAMMKVCDISRRDGLLGVAEVRSNSSELEEVCHLIGDAATDSQIQFNLSRRQTGEQLFHQMVCDVFLFAIGYAMLMGTLASIASFVANGQSVNGAVLLPLVCGACLSILMLVLLGRLRSAHLREMIAVDIAYNGARIILEDNNVQRLRNRLVTLVPDGLRK